MLNNQEVELSPLQMLAGEFSRSRTEGRRYSSELKARAVEMSSSGISRMALCEATGISPQSLSSWRKSSRDVALPRELRVREAVDCHLTGAGGQMDGAERMRLRFGGKIEICLPLTALTFDLLERLCRLGGAEC